MLGATRAKFAAISRDFVFLYANKAYAKQWDNQPDDLIGKHAKEILGADGFEGSLDKFVDAIAGETVNYEAEYTVDQRTFVLAIRLVPFYGTDQDSTDPGESEGFYVCLLYTSPSPRDATLSRMPSSA